MSPYIDEAIALAPALETGSLTLRDIDLWHYEAMLASLATRARVLRMTMSGT